MQKIEIFFNPHFYDFIGVYETELLEDFEFKKIKWSYFVCCCVGNFTLNQSWQENADVFQLLPAISFLSIFY